MRKYLVYFAALFVLGFAGACTKSENDLSNGGKNSPAGKSGSTARIIVKGDYLYAVDKSSLKVVDISNPADPVYVKTVNIGFGIETIYPFKDYLFIGSNGGVYIYGLKDPANPKRLSQFEHLTACDPVIANDSLAFVTLRNNNVCHRWNDTREIDVLDIKDILNPNIRTVYYTHYYPYGLDMNDSLLFVCHGENGLGVYDIHKILNNNQNADISYINGINAFDAILWQNKLFVIGESGFYQYDYSDIHNIKLISSISKNN